MNIRYITLALFCSSLPLATIAQINLKGTVTNSNTGEKFAGSRITLIGTDNVAMSDEDGNFELNVSKLEGILRIEAPGFDQQLVPILGRNSLSIKMQPTTKANPAYNEHSLSAYTTAKTQSMRPATVGADENIQMNLLGDVNAISHSGIDAGGMAMFVRGMHSINMKSQPLFIVDGQIWQSDDNISSLCEGYFSNPLSLLSPDDIESIEILKNGTAVWGAKAAGGVIIINTKRSHNMATEIEVNLSMGIKQKGKTLPMLNANAYRILATDLIGGMPGQDRNFQFMDDDPTKSYYNANHNNTDWNDEIGQTAMTQNYGISVRGGDEIALYSFSLGYSHNDGYVRNTNFDRLNVRFNSDINLTRQLKTRADIAFAQVTRNIFDDGILSETSPRYMAYIKSPLYSPNQFDSQGNMYDRLADVDELGIGNPMAVTDNSEGKNKNYRFTATLAPTYTFNDRLRLSALVGFSWDKIKESKFTPDFGLPAIQLVNAQGDWYAQGDNSIASLMTRHSTLTVDIHADWNAINSNTSNLKITGGYRFINNTFESDYGQGYNTGSDNLRSLSVTNANLRTIDGVNEDWRDMAWYAQADFDWKNRYFAGVQTAMETNSRFGRKSGSGLNIGGVAWGVFPSFNAAWVVTNEKFMRKVKGINFLKLHAGYEITGNDDLPSAATRTYFEAISYAGLAKGLALSNIGNDKLKWEHTGTFTVGIDMLLLNNRLSVRADYFDSTTKDLLVRKQLREEYGLQNYWTNDGSMRNRGFEVCVGGRIVETKDWQLNANVTMGHYKNEVERLTDGNFITNVMGANVLTAEGNPLGVFYGYKSEGVFTDMEDASKANLSVVDNTGRNLRFGAGDMHFADIKVDGIIDEHDMTIIGDPNPDIYGAFGFNVNWKRLSLDAIFTYSLGNDAFNAMRQQMENGSSLNNQSEAMLRRWTGDGQATDIPRATYGDPMGNSRFSDRWIEDASYLKLKQVSLSYSLPVKPRFIQGVQVWASVTNVFTMTKYLGTDPEFFYGSQALCQGIDTGLMPQTRTYNLGIKLNL